MSATGFGLGPFGLGGFGVPLQQPPAPGLSSLSSSRRIDAHGRYVQNAEGGFAAMPDVAQRVLLAVSMAVGPDPAFIDGTAAATAEQAIRAALAPLTSGAEPVAAIVSIAIDHPATGTLKRTIVYRDLTDGQEHTVSA